jgi:hypothetical protein
MIGEREQWNLRGTHELYIGLLPSVTSLPRLDLSSLLLISLAQVLTPVNPLVSSALVFYCLTQATPSRRHWIFPVLTHIMASNNGIPSQPARQTNMVDQDDVQDWMNRFNGALADSSVITAPMAPDARPWHESFFGCFAPIDTCKWTLSFGSKHLGFCCFSDIRFFSI